jgi:hypothetical protein
MGTAAIDGRSSGIDRLSSSDDVMPRTSLASDRIDMSDLMLQLSESVSDAPGIFRARDGT